MGTIDIYFEIMGVEMRIDCRYSHTPAEAATSDCPGCDAETILESAWHETDEKTPENDLCKTAEDWEVQFIEAKMFEALGAQAESSADSIAEDMASNARDSACSRWGF